MEQMDDVQSPWTNTLPDEACDWINQMRRPQQTTKVQTGRKLVNFQIWFCTTLADVPFILSICGLVKKKGTG